MRLYHIDRAKTFPINQVVSLSPLTDLQEENASSEFFRCFSEGISFHCLNTFHCKGIGIQSEFVSENGAMSSFIESTSLNKAISEINVQIIEFVFELVRRSCFSQLPSRLVSIFALKSIIDFSAWPELNVGEKVHLYEIEAPDDTPRFDANFLRGGIIMCNTPAHSYAGTLMPLMLDSAYSYWSGKQTDNPRWEYLIHLPFYAYGRRIDADIHTG